MATENIVDATGLQTKDATTMRDELDADFKEIYGNDINLDSDSPDGQLLNIIVQQAQDILNLITQIYTSFDPDQAFGVVLDQRVAYNGIQRQAGTHTITEVTVVVNRPITLYGIDQEANQVFIIQDAAGTQFVLRETVVIAGAGSDEYEFQAVDPGAVQTTPNTITIPVTIVLGVVSVNNPTTYLTLGINEETDAELKIRRQKSVSLASQGYLQGLLAALENISGVTSAFVYENDTAEEDDDGVPSHSIWVIIAGSPEDSDVANAIYRKRNAGCGMFGEEEYTIRPNGKIVTSFKTGYIMISYIRTPLDEHGDYLIPNDEELLQGLRFYNLYRIWEKRWNMKEEGSRERFEHYLHQWGLYKGMIRGKFKLPTADQQQNIIEYSQSLLPKSQSYKSYFGRLGAHDTTFS